MAIHLNLPYTLAPLLYLIFNNIIHNPVGGLVFTFLNYWGPSDYVYKIWLSLLKWHRFLFFDLPRKKNVFVIGSFYGIFHCLVFLV